MASFIRTAIASTAVLFFAWEANAQSFDCRYARQPDEITICGSQELGQLDLQMSNLYFSLKNSLGYNQGARLASDQAYWLSGRRSCGYNEGCIRASYYNRIQFLRNGY